MEYFTLDRFFSVLICLIFLLNIFISKKVTCSSVSPPVIFSTFWFLMTIVPIVLASAPINPVAVLYIVFCSLFFTSSSLFFRWKDIYICSSLLGLNKRLLWSGFLFIQGFSLAFIPVNLAVQGVSVGGFISNPFETSNYYLSLKYSGGVVSSIYSQVSTVFNYCGVSLAGLMFNNLKGAKKRVLLALAFLPSVFFMLLYADKGTLFLSLALFFGGVFVFNQKNNNNRDMVGKKAPLKLLLVLLTIFPFVLFSFISRGLYEMDFEDALYSFKNNLLSYAFGHMYSFSDWFSSYTFTKTPLLRYKQELDYTYGFYTFMSVFQFFGDNREVVHGIFDEYYSSHGITSNIYTFYRGVILDFGIVGSFVFFFTIGFFFNANYYVLSKNKRSILAIVIYIYMVGFIYTSYIISLMVWTSVFFSMIVLALVVFLNRVRW